MRPIAKTHPIRVEYGIVIDIENLIKGYERKYDKRGLAVVVGIFKTFQVASSLDVST